jgi:hypothetical protein
MSFSKDSGANYCVRDIRTTTRKRARTINAVTTGSCEELFEYPYSLRSQRTSISLLKYMFNLTDSSITVFDLFHLLRRECAVVTSLPKWEMALYSLRT